MNFLDVWARGMIREKRAIAILLAAGAMALTLHSGVALADGDPPNPALAKDYCAAFVKEAENARESRQKIELDALNEQLDKKLAEVTDKTAVLEKWVTERETILNQASTAILKIYDSMDPTIAAQELSKLDQLGASAILRKMKPKKASDILKEMDAATAARIIAIISSESNLVQSGTP